MRFFPVLALIISSMAIHGQQPLSLEQCIKRAQERNLDIRNAALDADLADKAHDQAYWSFLPNLNSAATHGYNWGKTIDQYTNTFATDRVRTNNIYLSSDVTLFQSGRKHKELKRSALDEQAANKALEALRNDISTSVARAFLDLLGMREQIAAAKGQAAATAAQVTLTRQLFDAGRVAKGELLDIQAQLAQDQYTVEDLSIQGEKARLALAQLMQLSPQEERTLDIAAPSMAEASFTEPSATEEGVMEKVLASNPAYKQAELRMLSSDLAIGIARSAALPALSFNASLGTGYSGRNLEAVGAPQLNGSVLIGTTDSGEPVYAPNYDQDTRVKSFARQLDDNLNESVGFTLSLPLFNNMRNRLATDQARVQYEQAKNNLAKSRNTLQVDVQNALTAQRGAYRQYVSAQLAVEAATEAVRMADERFAQHAITATDLNVAKARLAKGTSQLINAKYSYLMAEKALAILQGQPISL